MRIADAPFTIAVIVLCWIVFALDFFLPGPHQQGFGQLMLAGAIIPSAIQSGQWWRLITAGFLHFNLTHIFFNTYALLQAGTFVEYAYGSIRYVVIYAVALFVGSLVAYYTTIGTSDITAGASGAIMGVFGAMAVLAIKLPVLRGQLLRAALLPIVLTLGYGFLNSGISNAAHIGGVVSGAAVALALRPRIAARLVGSDEPEIIPPQEQT